MSIEIESADVVRLIQQYLKESNLTRTLSVIQVRTLIDVITIVIRATFTANQSFSYDPFDSLTNEEARIRLITGTGDGYSSLYFFVHHK